MTTKVPNYKEKLRAKLNSFDTVMSVFIYLNLVPYVMELVRRDRVGYLIDVENELLQMESLKTVKSSIFIKVCQLVEDETFTFLQNRQYEYILDYVYKNLDIVFHADLKSIIKDIESDRRFAHFCYVSVKFPPSDLELDKANAFVNAYYKFIRIPSNQKKTADAPKVNDYFDLSLLPNTTLANINMRALVTVHNELLDYISNFDNPTEGILNWLFNLKADYLELKRTSNTVLEKNLTKKLGIKGLKFSTWLYGYSENLFSLDDRFAAINETDRTEIVISQIDCIFIVNREFHKIFLDRTQQSWHSKTHKTKHPKKTNSRANEKKNSAEFTK